MVLELKKGDKIYLPIKNLKIRKKIKELKFVKVRLFSIKAKKRTFNSKPEILKDAKG